MTPESARRLCIRLMKKYGLVKKGWRFEWMKSKAFYGDCDCNTKIIRLSCHKPFIRRKDVVKDTILHEIAHALVPISHNHSKAWKKKAIELGCKPFSSE